MGLAVMPVTSSCRGHRLTVQACSLTLLPAGPQTLSLGLPSLYKSWTLNSNESQSLAPGAGPSVSE